MMISKLPEVLLVPVTPFHFGPGAALHSIAPKHISFLAFCAANVLVDIEPLYYMATSQFPLHRFFHTYLGISIVVAATIVLFQIARKLAERFPPSDVLGWKEISTRQLVIGAALGGYSHILLDSVMHTDIRPFAPISESNALFHVISLAALHWFCIVSASLGVIIIGIRRHLLSKDFL